MAGENVPNCAVVSDLHCGSRLGLYPCGSAITLDDGGTYLPSIPQQRIWSLWLEYWREWIPRVSRGDPLCVVVNGDAIDGTNSRDTTQISRNPQDQQRIARACLEPVLEAAKGRLYVIRGTSWHTGDSGHCEETLAESVGAIKNEDGRYSRYDLWLQLGGDKGPLCHFLHHIGFVSSLAYETTALMKEYAESVTEAGRWGNPVPDVVVRSHRHRQAEIRVQTKRGYGTCFTTPSWELKTPFAWKVPGARLAVSQIGGSFIRAGNEEYYTRHFVKEATRTATEVPR